MRWMGVHPEPFLDETVTYSVV